MNTNMTQFRCFSKILVLCALDESSLGIGRLKHQWVKLLAIINHGFLKIFVSISTYLDPNDSSSIWQGICN